MSKSVSKNAEVLTVINEVGIRPVRVFMIALAMRSVTMQIFIITNPSRKQNIYFDFR